MKKYILNPKVVRGGKAIPLGNNFYYMRGKKHEQGGIDLGADDKNGLEVEGGEVVHTSKNSIKVFSAVPMLNGKSPAEKVINGENANKVFKEQEEFKDRNNYNDDGSKKYQNNVENRSINTDYNSNENPILRSSFFKLGGNKDNPNIDYIYDRINKKNTPDFIRMRNPNRKFIKDWQNPNYISTNKVAIGTDENGQVFLYNEVQDDGKGGLIDMTNPINKQSDFDGMNRAIERQDTVHINSIEDGIKFSKEYKLRYPGFKRMGGQTKKNIFVELNVGGKKKLVPASSFTGERQKALMGINEDIDYINTPKYKGIIEEASITNPRLSPNNIYKQLTNAAGTTNALKIKKLNNINNKFSPAAGHFNEITLGDIIGGVTNTIGSITNYNSNRRTLNNMKYSSAPLPIQAKKLKTRFNINPQLDKIREYLKATNRDIDANTASSRVALARKGIARTNALLQTNNLYATKENAETQLLNQDNMNQQNVAARNVEMYNRWREGKSNFDNMLLEKHAENTSDLIRGLTTTVQDIIGGIEQRKNINNTLSTIAATNPNVTAEILKDLGVDFSYLIRNGKRIKNKKN